LAGAWTAHLLRNAFGMGAWFVLLVMAVVDVRVFSPQKKHGSLGRGFGWGPLLVAVCIIFFALFFPGRGGTIWGGGGLVGAWGLALLQRQFSEAGIALLLLTAFVVGMLLTTDALLFRVAARAFFAPFVIFHRLTLGRSKREMTTPLSIRE